MSNIEIMSDAKIDLPLITIGIAGGTGAGKSTIARNVLAVLGEENVAYLVHDDYYRDLSHLSLEERARINFDHPDSLETSLLASHLRDLKEGRDVGVPSYDFGTHSRRGPEHDRVVRPRRVLLVEGILIFAVPELVDLLDVKVFVDADPDVRLIRRVSRDVEERERSMESVMEQYIETVRPMHDEFVEPSKKIADVILPCERENDVGLQMIVNHLKAKAGLLS